MTETLTTLLDQLEAYGYAPSWSLVKAGLLLKVINETDVAFYATEKIATVTELELNPVACLATTSLTFDEANRYLSDLVELEADSTALAQRKWLVFLLNNVLTGAEEALKLDNLEAEDDPRILRNFEAINAIKPLLEREQDQEPIWVPDVIGHGITSALSRAIVEFRRWLEIEKNWITTEEQTKGANYD